MALKIYAWSNSIYTMREHLSFQSKKRLFEIEELFFQIWKIEENRIPDFELQLFPR